MKKKGIHSDVRKTSFDADINFYTPTLKIRLIREDSCELLWDDLYDKLDEIYHLKWRVLDSNDEFKTVNRTSNGYLIRDLTPSTSYETSIQVQGSKDRFIYRLQSCCTASM